MHQPDLAPSVEFPGGPFVAVGWLDAGFAYPTGRPEAAVYQRLVAFARRPWHGQVPVEAGKHQCNLCLFDGPLSHGRLFVPGDNVVYVCPPGITHYIAAHRYDPPREFQQAVLRYPDMHAAEYLRALARLGVPGYFKRERT